MIPAAIAGASPWVWLTWIGVGLLCGFFASNFLPGRRVVIVDLIVGTGGGVLGGWAAAHAMGCADPQAFIVTILVSMLASVVLLWLAGMIMMYAMRK